MEKINSIQSDAQANIQTDVKHDLIELNKVGMSDVQIGIVYNDFLIPCELSVFVNLRSGQRGIHMSRLYEVIQQGLNGQQLNRLNWSELLFHLVKSQEGLSHTGIVKLNFQLPLARTSLKSQLNGLRNYKLISQFFYSPTKKIYQQDFEILYSSTCPQSTQLAKELTKNTFAGQDKTGVERWIQNDRNFIATPHAQRSRMQISLQSSSEFILDLKFWITSIEDALKTPVQTAVKKADEMEFARLNGENPMFCEDAIRTVAQMINKQTSIDKHLIAYKVATSHEESLHPHNAVGEVQSKNFYQF
jgi:GTP cyclohydrolase IB